MITRLTVEQIFHAARDKSDPAERAGFLDGACGHDAGLRARIEALLQADAGAGKFLRSAEAATQISPSTAPTVLAAPRDHAGDMFGRYKLLQQIGEGGFGTVWMAEQREPVKRRVALKIIKLGMDTGQVIARFEAERQALAMMDHPHIAKVLDAGSTEKGRLYFVMEYIKGVPILEYCDSGKLDTNQRLDVFTKVCQAIQHAHQKGIIHRDIKPSNVLVTMHDGVPVPKVIDFGIAKATSAELTTRTLFTEHRQMIGTPAYMSPEQAEMSGLDIDTRSDIYSLGVLLYELLTGTTPFDHKELMSKGFVEMMRIIREVEPHKPSTRLSILVKTGTRTAEQRRALDPKRLSQTLKGDLDWIVMKCLEKDRTRRYETANSLALDLRRYLDGELVLAAPPSTVYRVRKFVRRNRAAVLAGSMVAIALVLGVIGTTGGMIWAIDQKGKANRAESAAEAARATASEQRDLAQDHLYESLLREARAIREGRAVGYREMVIERVQQAAAIPTAKRNPEALLTEASRCLGDGIGLESINMPDVAVGTSALAIDPNGTVVALGNVDGGLTIRDGRSGNVVARLSIPGRIIELRFAESGDRLFGHIDLQAPEDSPHVLVCEWHCSRQGEWALHSTRPEPEFDTFLDTPWGPALSRADPSGSEYRFSLLESGADVGTVPASPLALSPDYTCVAMRHEHDDTIVLKDLFGDGAERALSLGFGNLNRAVFNDDGNYLACWSESGIVVVDPTRGERVFTVRGYFAMPQFVDRSTLVVPAPMEQSVRLLDVASGWEVARLKMPANHVRVARVSRAVVGAGDSIAAVVQIGDTPERRHLRGHVGGVAVVEFSPDGTHLASFGKDESIRLWDASTGTLLQILSGSGPGQSLSFSPDGRYLASACYDRSAIRIWSLESFREVLDVDDSPVGSGPVYVCAFSPDGRYLAAGGVGLRVWALDWRGGDDRQQPPLAVTPVLKAEAKAWCLKFDDKSRWLSYLDAGSGQPGTYLVSLASDVASAERVLSFSGGVQRLDNAHRDGLFASMTPGQKVKIWDVRTRQVQRELPTLLAGEPQTSPLANMRISPDGMFAAVANGTGRGVNIIDIASGCRVLALPDESGSVWWLAWSPNSTLLAVSRSEGDISIWDVSKARALLADLGFGQPVGSMTNGTR